MGLRVEENKRLILLIVVFVVQSFCIAGIDAAPYFTDNKLSATKISYCERLTRGLGYRAYDVNISWKRNGLKMSSPKPSEWELGKISEPGFFSPDLYIHYDVPGYATPYVDKNFRYRAVCIWNKFGLMEFQVVNWDRGYQTQCKLPDVEGVYGTCP